MLELPPPPPTLLRTVPQPSGLRDRIPAWLVLATLGSWVALLLDWFFGGAFFTLLWILAIGVTVFLGLVVLVLTVLLFALLFRARRAAAGVATLAGALTIVGIVLVVPWTEAYPRIWFALNHDAFVRAAALAHAGSLATNPADDYYGADLPAGLTAISVDGKLATASGWGSESGLIEGPCGADPVWFAPAAIFVPDGAVGFVHLSCDSPPSDLQLNGFDDAMAPRIRLGDGWWWADGQDVPK